MNKNQKIIGIILIATGAAILLFVTILRGLSSSSPSSTPNTLYDNEVGLSWPTYEHSNQPFFGYAQRTPLRNIAPLNPYQAQRFGYRDDSSAYISRSGVANLQAPARVGIVFDKRNPERRFPLFCRPVYPGGNRFDYYVIDNSPNANPLGLNEHNGLELVTDDLVSINSIPGKFFVHIY